MNKKKVVVIVVIALIILVSLAIIVFTGNDGEKNNDKLPNDDIVVDNGNGAPSKIEADEKTVSKSMASELYEFIPKMYYEEIAPFTSVFMLDAAMYKIMDENEAQDFSTKNVDKYVKKLFGNDAKIDKMEVSTPDINKSIFYYSEDADTYAVIPVGYGGIFKMQIFKNATETDDAYYVYTYALNGIYYNDDESIITDVFDETDNFDENIESEETTKTNTEVKVIVGDKEGYDLVHNFDNETVMYNEEIWTKNYADKMPILRYTLKKDGKSYYLGEVEQINY